MRWAARGLRRAQILASAAESRVTLAGKRYRASAIPLCLVSHDAHRHGAQLLALDLARIFARQFGLELHIVLLGSGALTPQFRRYGRVHQLDKQTGPAAKVLARQLAALGVKQALCNSAASGMFVETLSAAGIRCVALVHELPQLIHDRNLAPHADAIRRHAAVGVFPSDHVRDAFPGGTPQTSMVMPQGLSRRRGAPDPTRRAQARTFLRTRFNISEDAQLVLGAGYGDLRKGIDLFVAAGARVVTAHPKVVFLWLGGVAPEVAGPVAEAMGRGNASRIVVAPFDPDIAPYFDGADVFALTSREDPFPSVLLQAQDVGLPVVAFRDAGGFDALLSGGAGKFAPSGDATAFADIVSDILTDQSKRRDMRAAATASAATIPSLRQYAFATAALVNATPPRVSVVVPNYNYARHLRARLRSIHGQTAPIYEVIFIDDCSTDESLNVARKVLTGAEVDWRIIEGGKKSPSVFAQWQRGVECAKGDLVWIAEADDLSDARFVEVALAGLSDPRVVLSYCQSRQIDEVGRTIDRDYLTYLSKVNANRWRQRYETDGIDEIQVALAVKNTIPNVSACLFRRDALLETLQNHQAEIQRYRVAGDWMTYIRLLTSGRVAYDPRPFNYHRRHGSSVTSSALSNADALAEIAEIQAAVQSDFDVPPAVKKMAADYIEELRDQFGLTR